MASFGWRASLMPRRTGLTMTHASSGNDLRIFTKRHGRHSNESSNGVRQFITRPYSAVYVSCQLEVKSWVVRSGRLSRYLSGQRSSKSISKNLRERALSKIILSRPERNRSVWNLYAECSCSFGMLSASTQLAIELMNLRCVVYDPMLNRL